MLTRPFIITTVITLFIVFLNSLYPIFEFLKLAIYLSIPVLILAWIVLAFRRNLRVMQVLILISFGYGLYFNLVSIGNRFHNYTWIRKYQADKAIQALNSYKNRNGNYPLKLEAVNVNFIPWTTPSYHCDTAKQNFYLYYNVGFFETATYVSQQKCWIYGD